MLEAIYDIVGREEALCTLLAHLARRFDCPSAAIVYIDSVRPLAAIEVGHGLFTDVVRARYHAEFAAIDPAPAALARLKIGEAAATDRVFSPEERAESRFLKEFYHPLGLEEAMGAPIAAAHGRFGIVAIHRGAARPPFGDAEIAEFAELATHIAHAVDLRRRFFAMARHIEGREATLDAVSAGLIVLDRNGRLDHANAAARAVLALGDGLILARDGRLRAHDRTANANLAAAMSAAADGDGSVVIIVPRSDGSRGYAVKVSAQTSKVPPRDGWLVHIADMRPVVADIPVVLAQALGLTAASASLVASLVRGDDVKTHSARAGIVVATGRFHLRAAFRATGTTRQADLVQVAVKLLRDLDL